MKHALIIEDEYFIAAHITDMLRAEGFRSFAYASTDKLAYDSVARRMPQLITADLSLLYGKGSEAVEKINKDFGPIPTVFVTGMPDAIQPAKDQRLIEKPISNHKFQQAVRDLSQA